MEKRMLLLAVMLVVVALCSPAALALDPMGPPSAGLLQGQVSIGVDYAFSDMDLELDGSGGIPSITHPDVQVNKVYANLGVGVMDNWSVFVRGGLSRAETDNVGMVGDIPMGSTEFAWGWGTKVTLFEQTPDLVWGGLFQMSFANESQERTSSPIVIMDTIEIDEMQVAIGPTWTPSEGLSLYGGPFYHWVTGEIVEESPLPRVTYDIDTDKFGVYGGARFEITEKASVNTEIQWTGDAVAFAASMLFKCN